MPRSNELKAINAILNALDARLEVVEVKQREMLLRIDTMLIETSLHDMGVSPEQIEAVTDFSEWLKRKVERQDTRKVRDAMKDAHKHLCTLDYELVALIADDILKIVHYGVWKSEGRTKYFELFHEGEDDDEIPF
ncbi:hypothetical protein PC9H_010190 [Pleurotus ostreatus]|uniref:Uncharacterized protein n=1 Tax=Pleurotus ostreatus TaxID=5322 RepID=A0A8H6ZR19_PLEOS|nr:uncharacterized protein PC9H_010190 [Pleurotus ostreatus]KAF7424879.1 hypothetical protein PC9H_010190 [Pleurotus ostreatus]KAJ8692098.1 hypothetical protein PTI98_009439 [Pleurotus ostreatus]